MMMICRD